MSKQMKVTLQTLEGISSISIVADDGRTLELKAGQPAILTDPNRGLVASITRLPVDVEDVPESSQPGRGGRP